MLLSCPCQVRAQEHASSLRISNPDTCVLMILLPNTRGFYCRCEASHVLSSYTFAIVITELQVRAISACGGFKFWKNVVCKSLQYNFRNDFTPNPYLPGGLGQDLDVLWYVAMKKYKNVFIFNKDVWIMHSLGPYHTPIHKWKGNKRAMGLFVEALGFLLRFLCAFSKSLISNPLYILFYAFELPFNSKSFEPYQILGFVIESFTSFNLSMLQYVIK